MRGSGLTWVARFFAVLVAVVVAVPLFAWVRIWYVARQDDHPKSDAIVVLGAGQYDGRPSAVFAARLEHAVSLYEEGVAPAIVTVGGSQPGDRFTEAAAAKRYLTREAGVPKSRIVAVTEGSDTLQSMRAVATAMRSRDWTTMVIVTDPWHALRSRSMAGDLGMEAATSPTRSGPSVWTRETQLRYITRETGAYLYYEVFGRSADWGTDAL
ncbi:MAG: YdcF family protein [Streptosporangiales bacterium]|nr:YdcF family protein [Streptosporangiales bacterium]